MKKLLKYVGIIIGGIITILLIFTVVGFMPQSTQQIKAVASQFKADDSWVLENESSKPGRLICLEGHCDEYSKTWRLSSNIDTEKFNELLNASGWNNLKISPVCESHANIRGSGETLCSASGYIDGYSVDLRAIGDHFDPSKARVVLSLER